MFGVLRNIYISNVVFCFLITEDMEDDHYNNKTEYLVHLNKV